MFKYVFIAVLGGLGYLTFFADLNLTNEMVGNLFIYSILSLFAVFIFFKFGVHYKIQTLNRFATAFYYAVFEYKKVQTEPTGLNYMDSVKEQAEVALAANFDPTLTAADLKSTVTLNSGADPFLDELRAKIQEAEKLKLNARQLDTKANRILGETEQDLADKNLITGKKPKFLDRIFGMVKGVAAIIDLTTSQLKDQSYGRAPDYEIISRIAMDRNPYFATTYKFFDTEDLAGLLNRAPFMIILMGIIGTFAGFYLALNDGGDIKAGAAVSIISSLVGLPVSLLMDYINTLYPDQNRYEKAFSTYAVSLEILFNHEQELTNIKKGRRRTDAEAANSSSGGSSSAPPRGKDKASNDNLRNTGTSAKDVTKGKEGVIGLEGKRTPGRKLGAKKPAAVEADDESLVFGAPRS